MTAEAMMVLLCVILEERKPAPRRDVKYPAEMRRKRDPAKIDEEAGQHDGSQRQKAQGTSVKR